MTGSTPSKQSEGLEGDGTIEPPTQRCVLMEFCDMGTLHGAVQEGRVGLARATGASSVAQGRALSPLQEALYCLLDMASAMEHMHGMSLIHGDLKSANVLLTSQTTDPRGYVCKVADFGLSRIVDDFVVAYTTNIGTVAYAAPEVLERGRVDFPADVYSWSMVAWEVVAGEVPHAGCGIGQVYYAVVVEQQRPQLPASCPPDLGALISQCWAHDPQERPTMAQVVRRLGAMLAQGEAAGSSK